MMMMMMTMMMTMMMMMMLKSYSRGRYQQLAGLRYGCLFVFTMFGRRRRFAYFGVRLRQHSFLHART